MGTKRRGLYGPSAADRTGWGGALRLGQTLEVAACEIAHLGSCHVGKILWRST